MTDRLTKYLDDNAQHETVLFQVEGDKGVTYLVEARPLKAHEIGLITKNWYGQDATTCPRCKGLGSL